MQAERLHPELARRLVDPVDRQPLRMAEESRREAAVRHARALGEAAPAAWRQAPELDGVLLTEDGRWAYPVARGMPVLLPEARLPLPEDG